MKLRRYSLYKPSGVAWLGEIPGHWEIKRLKNVVTYNDQVLNENTSPDYEIEYVDISSVNQVEGVIATECMYFENAPSRARRKVQPGDTLISTVRTYLKAIAYLEKPLDNMIASTGFAVLRPCVGFVPKYLAYQLQSDGFVDLVVAHSVGVSYPAINASLLVTLPVAVPSREEQHAIAAFLDRETGRIDKLIGHKRHFIDLLREKRAVLITRAVTRGLDPTVPMKDSGVAWLGEIPGHWEIKRLKNVVTYNDQVLNENTSPDYEIEYVDISSVNQVEGVIATECMYFENAPSRARRKVQPGDTLISTVRTYLKAIAYLEKPLDNMIASTGFAVLRPCVGFVPKYLAYQLQSDGFVDLVVAHSVGVSYPAINASLLVTLPVAVPSREEQHAIAAFLDRETARIDSLITQVEAALEKLTEYRAALITAAVTGKIDVRAAVQRAAA